MNLALRCLTVSVLSLAAAQAGAACYTVYDAAGRVVQQADQPPTTVAQAGSVPANGRVVLDGDRCTSRLAAAQPTAAARAASAPLFTDVQTAAAAQTPYAVVARNIAVVAPADAEQVWQQAPIAHPVALQPVGARATETVITEWADGRTDVEERPASPRR